jgi:BirA family biotin operon repressor/biotin-[acetyl-CoA-carboxylase] ligase
MHWRLRRFPILASTNDLALEWLRSGQAAAGDVLVAEEQLAGRGRPGRVWHSAKGALLFTAVLPFRPERVGWTSLTAGIAVAEAVRSLDAPAGVKWPNDVVLEGRKLAGILAETTATTSPPCHILAVGIGVNVTNPLPDDPALAGRAARLADFLPAVTTEQVLEAVLQRLAERWPLLAASDLGPLLQAWVELDTTRGRRVRWSQEDLTGVAQGVDDAGALLILADDGRRVAAAAGEVEFPEWASRSPK